MKRASRPRSRSKSPKHASLNLRRATRRSLAVAAQQLGADPLDDGSVVFLTQDAGDLGVDVPVVVAAVRERYEVAIEHQGVLRRIAHSTDPALALQYATQKVRYLQLEMPMKWESGCKACHRVVRSTIRRAGSGISAAFDINGFLDPAGKGTRMWFADRRDAHAFSEERTPPDCPIELAGYDREPDESESERNSRYREHRRGPLMLMDEYEWIWHAALEIRGNVARGVARLERGHPADDAVAHLPPAFADRYDLKFLTRYLIVVDNLCERLLTRNQTVPGCAAQEIALGAMVSAAEQLSGADLDDFREAAFEDLDFEWLYQQKGLAVLANSHVQDQLRPAYLGFHDWFTPFRDERLPLAVLKPKTPPPPRVRRLLARARRATEL